MKITAAKKTAAKKRSPKTVTPPGLRERLSRYKQKIEARTETHLDNHEVAEAVVLLKEVLQRQPGEA